MKQVDLGTRGKNLTVDMLAVGGPFARLVLQRADASLGIAWSLLPDKFDVDLAESLTSPIDWAGQHADVRQSLIDRMQERLLAYEGWLLVEDRYLTDPGMEGALPTHFFAQTTAYYYVSGSPSVDMVEQTVRYGSLRPFLGFLGAPMPTTSIHPGEEASPDLLSELATLIQVVVVGLFDDESYLFLEV